MANRMRTMGSDPSEDQEVSSLQDGEDNLSLGAIDDPFGLGPWQVFPAQNLLKQGDLEVVVQPKTIRLLCVLAAAPGRTFSREELLSSVWDGILVSDAAVDRAVCNLRKALGDSARSPEYVQTVRKRGIRLMQMVNPIEDESLTTVAPDPEPIMRASFPGIGALPTPPWSARSISAVAALLFVGLVPQIASTPARVVEVRDAPVSVVVDAERPQALPLPVTLPTFEPLLGTGGVIATDDYDIWIGRSYEDCDEEDPHQPSSPPIPSSAQAADDDASAAGVV